MRVERLEPRFVEEVPLDLESGVLYVSMEFATALHLCACGCGSEVVTPLHPTRWRLSYDGQGVSLHPSVGNGSLPCRSHYFVRDNQVRWARWSKAGAERARERDRADTAAFFTADPPTAERESSGTPQGRRRWPSARRVWHWLRGA